ncbi:hypothetical protein NPIL_428991 [Nephila pilipes]|uniref:Uncharacterized protein n=1 Tax=Nephila pilipes TaxID=299642 RepID=A0A8X6Q9Y9_NEPPI|nr:hypothetical protein NPIL_428991 [Nephila pilipes]
MVVFPLKKNNALIFNASLPGKASRYHRYIYACVAEFLKKDKTGETVKYKRIFVEEVNTLVTHTRRKVQLNIMGPDVTFGGCAHAPTGPCKL